MARAADARGGPSAPLRAGPSTSLRASLLDGKWAWAWNEPQIGEDEVVRRAVDAGLAGVLLKIDNNFLGMLRNARDRGLLVIAELYGYPASAREHAETLSWAIDQGASGACLNAESPWETVGGAAETFCRRFRELKPDAPLFAATDFRLERLRADYHIELSRYVDGFVPMIYPSLFRPSQPPGYIEQAWQDVMECWSTKSERLARRPPVFPAVQCFTDWNAPGVGTEGIDEEYRQAERYDVPGVSWYTIEDAAPEEWARVKAGEIGVARDEEARQVIADLKRVVQAQGRRVDQHQQVIADVKRTVERQGHTQDELRRDLRELSGDVQRLDGDLAGHAGDREIHIGS